jgi:hypothetical protein
MLRTTMLAMGGALVCALPVGAQSVKQVMSPAVWTADVTAGVLSQPMDDGGSGPAFALGVARRLGGGASRVAISALVAGAGVADVGAQGANRVIIDRDWVIAGLGAELSTLTTRRFDLAFGGKAGILFSRDKDVGTVGTPLPGSFTGQTNWEKKAGLILDARALYQISGPVAIAARAAMIQHVFTDDMLGGTGGLLSIGVALRR